MTKLFLALALLCGGCSKEHTVIGPDFPSYHNSNFSIYRDYPLRLVLQVNRLPGKRSAEYHWFASPEEVVSAMLAYEDFKQIREAKKPTGTLVGDCVILMGKKYCTGVLCGTKR